MFGLFGLVWIIIFIGIMIFSLKLVSDEELIRKVIKWRNTVQGVETKITPITIRWVKISAIFCIIVGVLMFFTFINGFLFFLHFE